MSVYKTYVHRILHVKTQKEVMYALVTLGLPITKVYVKVTKPQILYNDITACMQKLKWIKTLKYANTVKVKRKNS